MHNPGEEVTPLESHPRSKRDILQQGMTSENTHATKTQHQQRELEPGTMQSIVMPIVERHKQSRQPRIQSRASLFGNRSRELLRRATPDFARPCGIWPGWEIVSERDVFGEGLGPGRSLPEPQPSQRLTNYG